MWNRIEHFSYIYINLCHVFTRVNVNNKIIFRCFATSMNLDSCVIYYYFFFVDFLLSLFILPALRIFFVFCFVYKDFFFLHFLDHFLHHVDTAKMYIKIMFFCFLIDVSPTRLLFLKN